jgi:hypothetical protein
VKKSSKSTTKDIPLDSDDEEDEVTMLQSEFVSEEKPIKSPKANVDEEPTKKQKSKESKQKEVVDDDDVDDLAMAVVKKKKSKKSKKAKK